VADSKVLQWANEARRLKVPELLEHIEPHHQTLLLAVIRHARCQVLGDSTQMLLRLVRKIRTQASTRNPSPDRTAPQARAEARTPSLQRAWTR
jgi:hypothetical protein